MLLDQKSFSESFYGVQKRDTEFGSARWATVQQQVWTWCYLNWCCWISDYRNPSLPQTRLHKYTRFPKTKRFTLADMVQLNACHWLAPAACVHLSKWQLHQGKGRDRSKPGSVAVRPDMNSKCGGFYWLYDCFSLGGQVRQCAHWVNKQTEHGAITMSR